MINVVGLDWSMDICYRYWLTDFISPSPAKYLCKERNIWFTLSTTWITPDRLVDGWNTIKAKRKMRKLTIGHLINGHNMSKENHWNGANWGRIKMLGIFIQHLAEDLLNWLIWRLKYAINKESKREQIILAARFCKRHEINQKVLRQFRKWVGKMDHDNSWQSSSDNGESKNLRGRW